MCMVTRVLATQQHSTTIRCDRAVLQALSVYPLADYYECE
jgi:hypothetical protein